MRKRMPFTHVLLLTFWVFQGCGAESVTGLLEEGRISVVARVYLDAALDIMQAHSINRYKIDWPTFREEAFAQIDSAQTTADTYDAIRFALKALGDNHSFFQPPGGQAQDIVGRPLIDAAPSARHLGDSIGYVEVSAFTGGREEANALATSYHLLIEGVDTLGVCGWVVDLRGNLGGNMWPMVAGVGPIVGQGILGFFVDPDSVVSTWRYVQGKSLLDTFIVTQASDPYELLNPDPPVAVLTDGRTASSGEATTIAFRGRPDSRSFGEPTWGVSTANAGFPLSDGARIVLTVSTMADRTGTLYGEKVIPDEIVEGLKTGDPATDLPLRSAMEWLQAQAACEGG